LPDLMSRTRTLLRTILQPLAIAVGLAAVARTAMHIYAIPSASMAPTLRPGDQIVVTRYLGTEPERGDVVVFHSPNGSDELMVKRIVGVAGDLIDSRLGRLRVGGHTVAEPYVLNEATTGAIQAQLIPAGSFFVLGDNRENSYDSRSWGLVSRDRIVGHARLILWSSTDAGHDVALAESGGDEARRAPLGNSRDRIFKWIE
jgi:signal peptidase I